MAKSSRGPSAQKDAKPNAADTPKAATGTVNPFLTGMIGALISLLVAYFGFGRSLGTVEGQLSQLKSDFQSAVKAEVSGLQTQLSTVATNVSTTSTRLDRIANVLPDMRVRIASEELNRPMSAAVVATNPIKDADGIPKIRISIIGGGEDKAFITYVINVDDASEQRLPMQIVGIGKTYEPKSATAFEMIEWGKDSKVPVSIPGFVNPGATVCFHNTDARKIKDAFEIWGMKPSSESTISDIITTFPDLAETISKSPEKFQPPK